MGPTGCGSSHRTTHSPAQVRPSTAWPQGQRRPRTNAGRSVASLVELIWRSYGRDAARSRQMIVSVPTENPRRGRAAGPADDPLELRDGSHGLRVIPPNHTLPRASAPIDSLATRTAPASLKRWTGRVDDLLDLANRSFAPHGIPGPLYRPPSRSASAACSSASPPRRPAQAPGPLSASRHS